MRKSGSKWVRLLTSVERFWQKMQHKLEEDGNTDMTHNAHDNPRTTHGNTVSHHVGNARLDNTAAYAHAAHAGTAVNVGNRMMSTAAAVLTREHAQHAEHARHDSIPRLDRSSWEAAHSQLPSDLQATESFKGRQSHVV